MKRLFRCTAILLAVWMLLSALPLGAAASFAASLEIPATLPPIVESDTGKQEIDAAGEAVDLAAFKAYRTEHLAACEASIDVSQFSILKDRRGIISDVIYYALPEAFHVDARAGIRTWSRGNYVTKIDVSYYLTASEYQYKLEQVRAARDKLLEGIVNNRALTDVQKALLLHDRLANHVAYTYPDYPDPASFTDQTSYALAQSAAHHERATVYSALVDRKAVCQGYALTYGYLLDQVGIENYYESSDALNHAWNMVRIDGVLYFVDVTWDDPYPDVPGRVTHNNFLLSTNAFRAAPSGHDATDFETLPLDTRYDNAFWKCSQTAFQVIGNNVYYVDNDNAAIKDWEGSLVKQLSPTWDIGGGYYYNANYTRLAAAGANLLYSTNKDIQEMDPDTGLSGTAYALNWALPEDECIYGFVYEEPYFLVYKSTSPNNVPANPIYVYYEAVPFVGKPVLSLHPMIDGAEVASIVLEEGEWVALQIDLDPVDADNQNLTWAGDWDSAVVDVFGADRGGFITAVASGTTQITIFSTDGPSITIPVTVTRAARPVQRLIPMIDGVTEVSFIEMAVGDMVNLQIDLDPYDADNQNLTWYGWDESVIRVAGIDRGGFIWGDAPGTTAITIYSTDGISIDVPVTVYTPVCDHQWTVTEDTAYRATPATCCSPASYYAHCSVCGEVDETETFFLGENDYTNHVGTYVRVNERTASCTEEGYTGDLVCSACNTIVEAGTLIFPSGHDWGEARYDWTENNMTGTTGGEAPEDPRYENAPMNMSCTAWHVCSACGAVESATVEFAERTVIPAGCEGEGVVYFTAEFASSTGFETQYRYFVTDPALGHDWGEATYTWSNNCKSCAACRVCTRCGRQETEAVKTTEEVITKPTADSRGLSVFTAVFETFPSQTVTVETEPLSSIVWGDANDDGVVNNKDIVRLKNYMANLNQETGVSTYTLGPA